MGADLAYLTTGDSADPLRVSRRQREIAPASQVAPLERLATFAPANSATGIRTFFGGTTGIGPAPTLLQLQRRYGNRYVQRLVAPAAVQRKCAGGGRAHSGGECDECRQNRLSGRDEHDHAGEMPGTATLDALGPGAIIARQLQRQDGGGDGDGNGGGNGGGGSGDLPSPLGQSITCSVDPIKIAKALGGDKSAALEILNCCESGFSPLPAGCTKSLIDALRKLLGKKPSESTTKCPPGFHAAKSTTYKGQCCADSSTIESAQSCCPGERANLMGFCCPEGQIAQGLGCVASPSAPAPSAPEATPSEPGDYELPQDSNVAVA